MGIVWWSFYLLFTLIMYLWLVKIADLFNRPVQKILYILKMVDYTRRQDRSAEYYIGERLWRDGNVTLAPNGFTPPRNGRWYKCPQYPESFQMKPQRGDIVPSTLYKDMPFDLVSPPEYLVIHNHWNTTTGQAHNVKILPRRFQQEILVKAPAAMNISYLFPYCEDRVKMTSERLLYNPNPFPNTTTKSDYRAVRPIADFDYQNGPLVQVTHPRCVRFVRRTELKPGFPVDEAFSVYRKFNPYMSTMKIDYRNPTKDLQSYGSFSCC